MKFQADHSIVKKYITKYKNYIYFLSPLIFLYGFGTFLLYLHRVNLNNILNVIITIFVVPLSLLAIIQFVRSIKNNCTNINRMIGEIEINSKEIEFKTLQISMFLKLINKEPLYAKDQQDRMSFELSETQSVDKTYTGKIYSLIYAGDEYLIPENFFNDFESLKSQLTMES